MASMDEAIEKAAVHLAGAARVAVLSGAGISSESGIPTFRGAGGLWEQHRAEDLATPAAFSRDPELVWRWYDWRRGLCAKANPNAAHVIVAAIEKAVPEFLLVTQNVDGLHRRAGSAAMIELHGSIWRGRCTACAHRFDLTVVPLPTLPPLCPLCGGPARPDVVWFGESYDPLLLDNSQRFLKESDVLLVVGTSGMVSVPVYLAEAAAGAGTVVINVNPEASPISRFAAVEIPGRAGAVLPQLWQRACER